ncbi:hypothetical protein [Lysobacter sp. Hz 25]|uniref:hypothetical protein n=1 Tax=Lysobacter sp. Hz 25 TaxID=3383698 RepID=UPI0038D49EEB
MRSYAYDAFVLDRLLPDGDGLSLLRQWRERGVSTPALFLTACDRVEDRQARCMRRALHTGYPCPGEKRRASLRAALRVFYGLR